MNKQVQRLIGVRDQLEILDDEFSEDVRAITGKAHHHIETAIALLEVICDPVKHEAICEKPPCAFCVVQKKLHIFHNFCGRCGRAFNK